MNITTLFNPITPEEIPYDPFTLAGKIHPVITAGTIEHHNAMTASGGGMGILFRKPATWCIIQTTRYTLELIEKEKTYTLSYFHEEHRKQLTLLGSKSGRDSDKMKEIQLNIIQTPSANIAFKEAQLIIECKLTQVTTPQPNDFRAPEAIDYINEAYKDADQYRKYIFGEITHVWLKK